ncbi:MAG: insulinase family protein [Bacteroidales bacterium]|nr:insulinase family protein [Bacteroidales bacterium]
MIMNRTTPPPLNIIEKSEFLKPVENHTLAGNPYFSLFSDNLQILKLDLMFPAGSIFDENPAIPVLTANLITAGTKSLSSLQIAETIDFHGVSISFSVSKKYAIVQVNFLSKFADEVFNLLSQLFESPNFPQSEIDLLINKSIRHLQINMEKVGFVASQKFNEMLFSENHPFGKNINKENYKNLKSKQLFDFFIRHYQKQKPIIVISGDINTLVTQSLENFIDEMGTTSSISKKVPAVAIPEVSANKVCFKKTGVQSAIRYGKLTINKYHSDYGKLVFTNTLLGGYFGSRLIKNIREEKGYTYGIYSHLNSFTETGIFFISADVGSDYGQATLDEVNKEIIQLQENFVSSNEMERVRNYMTGILLQKFDGIFAISDAFIELKKFNFDWDYYTNLSETIKNISSEDVNEMAKKYFNTNEMSSLIVGKC